VLGRGRCRRQGGRRRNRSALSARVCPAIRVEQAVRIDGGVDLGGGEAGVTQQFLDRAEVAPSGEQVGGKGVAQGVRRGRRGQAKGAAQLGDAHLDQPRRQHAALDAAEQRRIRLGGERA